jgi:hypothetical protein
MTYEVKKRDEVGVRVINCLSSLLLSKSYKETYDRSYNDGLLAVKMLNMIDKTEFNREPFAREIEDFCDSVVGLTVEDLAKYLMSGEAWKLFPEDADRLVILYFLSRAAL